ncbi:hypothetical protein K469DRAFT_738867 [Zopfia rhizophila CBS 207.26]|uniref:Uncharacterized protein n=1 Tax=Zopfia rhizophila CBS 207.26 TaxID=1314779 RepID=A0A6A6E357_9PEZI|nr:hypothetical protein K469DRAFT_738867 [Zopfia rhizophila CBS 207.26]
MAITGAKLFDIPGFNKTPTIEDLEESRQIYNMLPDDSHQPELTDTHIRNLAALFLRNRANGILGIHLAHAHFHSPENTVMLGANYENPYCRWARATKMHSVDLSNVHGHIFVLTDHGFHPYEYQAGPMPDLSGVDKAFLPELADYLNGNNLAKLVGLQVVDDNPAQLLEFILPQATVMLDESDLVGCAPTRQTGWKFRYEDGEPRVCQSNESHGRTATTHEIYNQGQPHPKLETFQQLKHALAEVGIMRA